MCNVIIANEGEWEKHVEESEGIRNLKSPIETMLQKKNDLGRHSITRHNETVLVTADSGKDDWEQLDPGNVSVVVGSTLAAPGQRRFSEDDTRPTPVCAPTTKSKVSQDLRTPCTPSQFRHPMTTPWKRSSIVTDLSLTRDADSQTQRQLVDASTKTKDQFIDVGLQTEGHTRRKLARVPETYLRDGKTVLATQKKKNIGFYEKFAHCWLKFMRKRIGFKENVLQIVHWNLTKS